jgi:hypothetical protein
MIRRCPRRVGDDDRMNKSMISNVRTAALSAFEGPNFKAGGVSMMIE